MGAISEMLNTLGYSEYPAHYSEPMKGSVDQAESKSVAIKKDILVPSKGYLTNGTCAGCELSARYF